MSTLSTERSADLSAVGADNQYGERQRPGATQR
jgi:hypothetical protein